MLLLLLLIYRAMLTRWDLAGAFGRLVINREWTWPVVHICPSNLVV